MFLHFFKQTAENLTKVFGIITDCKKWGSMQEELSLCILNYVFQKNSFLESCRRLKYLLAFKSSYSCYALHMIRQIDSFKFVIFIDNP